MRSAAMFSPAMMDCILTPGMKINLLLLSRLCHAFCCRQEKQLIRRSASQRGVEWGHLEAKGVGMLGTCRALLLAAHLPTCALC